MPALPDILESVISKSFGLQARNKPSGTTGLNTLCGPQKEIDRTRMHGALGGSLISTKWDDWSKQREWAARANERPTGARLMLSKWDYWVKQRLWASVDLRPYRREGGSSFSKWDYWVKRHAWRHACAC
jgi:hypothetical protein